MKIEDDQGVRQCAIASAEVASILATAGTLCVYGGSDCIGAGVNLIVDATVTADIAQAYTNLMDYQPQEDIYTVALTEPIQITPTPTDIDFEIVLQDLSKHLLFLHAALRNLQRSYARYQGTQISLEGNNTNPHNEMYQDTHLFAVLQRQAIWRHLMLCAQLHTDVLMSASRVNLLWHKFRQRLPNQNVFTSHEIGRVISDTWQVRTQDIAKYHLTAFGIHMPPTILEKVRQQASFQKPILLLDNQWHKSMSQLEQSYQQTLHTFYSDTDED